MKILDMLEIEKKIVNESSIREVMKNRDKFSLFYRLLRIRLKRQNPLLSYVRERERGSTL